MLFSAFALSALAVSASAQQQSLQKVLAGQPSLANLTTYLGAFPDLEKTLFNLTNITILAPNNNAFDAPTFQANSSISQPLLEYHVLNGSFYNFDGISFPQTVLMPPNETNVTTGQVVEADGNNGEVSFYSGLLQNASTVGKPINFTGGVLHIIDAVLTVPSKISTTATDLGLSSVVGALTAAGLADTVDDLPDITAFVPNNAAFQSIASTLATLPPANISQVLEYHVINGTVGYSTMLKNTTLTTVLGLDLRITISNGSVFVNDAKVVVPNVLVANGVVHVIDQVLNPMNISSQSLPANSSMTVGQPAYANATSAQGSGSGVPFTSGVATPTSAVVIPTMTAAGTTGGTGGATSASQQSTQSTGAAVPAIANPAAMRMAALLGAGAFVMNM